MTSTDFQTLNLPHAMLENLNKIGFKSMTPIQQESLPSILKNIDVIAQAKTGSGKTVVALNLLDDPRCRITIGDAVWDATARLLEGSQHAEAVRDLILRYGTPSENLGSGPAFELTPVTEPATS